jgi:L-threonylcarbamoyladenylate synthase
MQVDSIENKAVTFSMNQNSFSNAVKVLKEGGVIAYPTESCFGLGCDPRDHSAIRRILRIKRRSKSKGLILVSDNFSRFRPFVTGIPETTQEMVLASWPGPNTWCLPTRPGVSSWLKGGYETLAVRVSKDRTIRSICSVAEMAIVSTSANRFGKPSLRTYEQVIVALGADVDYVVPGITGLQNSPSTIRDGLTGKVIRGQPVN